MGLTVLVLASWAWRRPRLAPKMGWWGATWVLVLGALLTQALTLVLLRWPDGSMATYGVLILVLALLRLLLTRSDSRLS